MTLDMTSQLQRHCNLQSNVSIFSFHSQSLLLLRFWILEMPRNCLDCPRLGSWDVWGAHSQTGSLSITHASCSSTDKTLCLQGVKRSTAIEYATAPCGMLSLLCCAPLSSFNPNWLWIKWSLWQLDVARSPAGPRSPILWCWLPERAPSHTWWNRTRGGLRCLLAASTGWRCLYTERGTQAPRRQGR